MTRGFAGRVLRLAWDFAARTPPVRLGVGRFVGERAAFGAGAGAGLGAGERTGVSAVLFGHRRATFRSRLAARAQPPTRLSRLCLAAGAGAGDGGGRPSSSGGM